MGTNETHREGDRVTRPQEIGEALYRRLSVDGAAALGHTRSANFDAVRAIAALMVLAAHAYAFSPSRPRAVESSVIVRSLSSGIALFFVLSGFLIAGPFLRSLLDGRRPPAAGRYALRRAARILPGYWVALIAGVALVTSSRLVDWWQVPLHASLMQNLVLGEPNRLLSVAWTLSIEAAFYIFVPIATFAVWRALRGRRLSLNQVAGGVLALGVASVAWLLITKAIVTPHAIATGELPRSSKLLGWVLPNYLYAFVPGALIYLGETSEAQARGGVWAGYRRAKERPELLAIGAILLLALSVTIVKTTHNAVVYSLHDVVLALGGGLGVMAFTGDGPRRRAAARLLAPIGLISYGIYLWHAVIRGALQQHALSWVPGVGGGIFAWPFQVAFLLGLTVPVALASWMWLERPLLRRTAAWDRRRRESRETPPSRTAGETTAAPAVV
jgi:peptidoglycan/LPS O-acetylase OafA/YrhL